MKKSLESDWLRALQFFVNTVQKQGNIMQKEGNKMHISYRKKMWLANKQQKYIRTNQVPQSACGKLAGALKFASGKTASVQSWY